MTLLSVTKDVCATVGVQIPTSVFTNITGNRTMQEMLSLANETAQKIAYDRRDWTKLRKVVTIAGDGVANPPPPAGDGQIVGTTAFNLPADYKRLLLTTGVWRSTYSQAPMMFIPDTDQWLWRRANNVTTGFGYGFNYGNGEWTMLGGQILIFPAMAVGQSAFFAYLNKNCVALSGGGFGDSFMADGDSFALDERLLKLGMTWQWKAQKGSPYNEDMATYEDAMNSVEGRDSPAPILVYRPPIIDGWAYANCGW
jgi:hypothetical protein